MFKNNFVIAGNFERLYQGNTTDIFDLELKTQVDYVILGKKESSFSQDPKLEDLISCILYLDLKIYSVLTGEIISTNSFKVAGVGIDNKTAEQQAIERIIEKAESYILDKIKK